MLIILFAGILLISCASGDNQSTMAALGSGAVFTQKTKPNLPMTARRQSVSVTALWTRPLVRGLRSRCALNRKCESKL